LAAAGLLATAGCSGCTDTNALDRLSVELAVSPSSLTFEATPLGFSRSAVVELRNTGAAPLDGLTLRVHGADFSVASAPERIAAGQAFRATVTFAPSSIGLAPATLVIDASEVDTSSVALTGVGVAAASCDDENPCTTDTPQIDGSCVHAPLEGACDDSNACTEGELCVGDRCLGDPLICTPPADCFVGLCDTETGCAFVAEVGACDDADPCTIDTCTAAGCRNETAPDGTPCGPFVQCQTINLCVVGLCVEAAVPEGTPCSDGDACTEDDTCVAEVCGGRPVTRPTELVSFAPTFGRARAIGTVLGDGRVLVLDPLDDDRGAIATVLDPTGPQITRVGHEVRVDLTGLHRATVIATSTSSQLALLDDQGLLRLFDVDAAGVMHTRGSTNTGLMSVSGRPSVVASRGFVYACSLGDTRVSTIDARDASAPVVTDVIRVASGCSGLAVDPINDLLFVSTYDGSTPSRPGGFYGMRLTDPGHPRFASHSGGGGSVRLATNGSLLALGDAGPFGRTSTITLLDPSDLSLRGRFDAGSAFFSKSVADLAFVGDRLFVQSRTALSAWDVGDPAAPVRLFTVERSGVGNGSNMAPPNALAVDAQTIFRVGEAVYGGVPLLLDIRNDTPVEHQHPARGGVTRLVQRDGALFGLEPYSVHRIDDTDHDAPVFNSGSIVPRTASATLWSLGAAASPPRVIAASQRPGVFTSAYRLVWRDGRDPSQPLALSAAFAPFRGGVQRVDDDGHRALSLVVRRDGAGAELRAWDLGRLQPASAETDFMTPELIELTDAVIDDQYSTIAFDGTQVVASVVDPVADPHDETERLTSHLFVVDASRLSAMTVTASIRVDGYVLSASVHRDRVAVLMKRSGGLCCGRDIGEVIRTYRISGATLRLEGTAPLPESRRVLYQSESSAVISTRAGAAFASLGEQGPAVLGDVELPEAPDSVAIVGERMWLSGDHGVSVVRPPCPTRR